MSLNRADLHIHTCYSDGLLEPEDAVNYAVARTSLRVIAITDHNTLDGARHAYDYWQHNRDAFSQIQVVIGEEISTTDGHMLGLFLHEPVPPHLTPAETVRAIHEQGGLAIAAHPFTHLLWFGDLKGIGRQIADLPLDGVEVRNSVPTELYANWITAMFNARHLRHTPVGGSDCHYLPMLGRTYTVFEGSSAAELQQGIRAHTARPGGAVNGPLTVAQFVRDQLRRHQLSLALSNDHQYRHATTGFMIDVEELRDAPGAVLHCTGRLTRANADLLKAEIVGLLQGGLTQIVLNMTLVSFVDSAGVGAIVAGQKRARALGGAVALCGLSDGVFRTMQLLCLDKIFGIYATPPQAAAALHSEARRL
jgi:anti-anti-sigma factor